MRRRLLFVVAATTLLTLALPASAARRSPAPPAASRDAASQDAASRDIVVALNLRASGEDEVVACEDQPLGPDGATIGRLLVNALNLRSDSVIDAPAEGACVRIRPSTPLTRRVGSAGRGLTIDTKPIAQALRERDATITLVVCTPLLTDSLRIITGAPPAGARGCENGGYAWDAAQPLDATLVFTATGKDLRRATAAALSWVIAVIVLSLLAGLYAGRRYHWRRFRQSKALTYATVTWFASLAVFGWKSVAYHSHLVHALQLRGGIGVAGEVLIVVLPAAASALAIVLTAIKISRDAVRNFPSANLDAPAAVPPLAQGTVPDRFRGDIPTLPLEDSILPYPTLPARPRHLLLQITLIPAAAFAIALALFTIQIGSTEIKIEGMLATLVAYLLAVPAFHEGLLPHVYGAVRMERNREDVIVATLVSLGSRVREIWLSPVAPAAFPYGGAVVRAGRRAILWQPLADGDGNGDGDGDGFSSDALSQDEIAGAIVLRAARKRAWPSAGVEMLVTIGVASAAGTNAHIPLWVLTAPVVLVASIGLAEVVGTIRTRSACSRSGRIEALLLGSLKAARTTARLAAAGSLGLVDVQAPSHAVGVWTRSVKTADSIAAEAGLPPTVVARLVDEIRITELQSLITSLQADPVAAEEPASTVRARGQSGRQPRP